ncbi:serine hydrolase domain-containing protein [Flavicella sediminum]|uniref:serine hydrolase domain-containing protein n=1 Tax=Flavicella sediminum TaxID=2585141 RepID=UPI00111D4A27|nr:serine hydrolase [Flavicella sediminum]
MKNRIALLLFLSVFFACSKSENLPDQTTPAETSLYFPPTNDTQWETIDINSLNWNTSELENLYNYLLTNDTRAFIVLKEGKIAIEKYWGNTILNKSEFNANSQWYWASASKALTATLVGIAQKEGKLDLHDKTSDYLGNAWTSTALEKEDLITIKHQLSMTTGLNYNVSDLDCQEPDCLAYGTDAGDQWYYHNAPYTLLHQVLQKATGMDYNLYTNQKIKSVIGMDGKWITTGSNTVYWSTARAMARFGLLTLNKGVWKNTEALYKNDFFFEMTASSQNLNPSYGYLWWLNGKNKIALPGISKTFPTSLATNAPDDLFAGMGKNGQFVAIVPSQNLVVIRMGEDPSTTLVPVEFHNKIWEKLNAVLQK